MSKGIKLKHEKHEKSMSLEDKLIYFNSVVHFFFFFNIIDKNVETYISRLRFFLCTILKCQIPPTYRVDQTNG